MRTKPEPEDKNLARPGGMPYSKPLCTPEEDVKRADDLTEANKPKSEETK